MDFWDRLAEVRERNDVLAHSFYRRWSAGELTRSELTVYAGEYRHAVVALADAAEGAAADAPEPEVREQLSRHAAEERDHVELWDEFARDLDADVTAPPLAETRDCATVWAGGPDRPYLERLVALYAVEAAQPAISRTKLRGLQAHYGVESTAYFEVHVERDVEHAREGRELIEAQLAGADHDRLLAVAESALRANWTLLDGVERVR